MPAKNPPHPGVIIRELCIDPLELSITDAAQALDVTRPTLSKLVNGKSSISPEMAVKLAKAFGSTAAFWLRVQMQYDLVQIEKNAKHIRVNHTFSHHSHAPTPFDRA